MKTEHKIIAAILIGSLAIVGNTVWKESENAKKIEALKKWKIGEENVQSTN